MKLFKLYMKLMRAHKNMVFMYLGIFMVLTIFNTLATQNSNTNQAYSKVKTDITIVDKDQSELSTNLTKHLAKTNTLVDVGESEMDIKDALFYHKVSIVIEIPKGFETSFKANAVKQVKTEQSQGDANGTLVEKTISSYMQNMAIYYNANTEKSIAEIDKQVGQDMDNEVHMRYLGSEKDSIVGSQDVTYFNYMSYIMIAIMVLVIGLTMNAIYNSEIRKRNLITPISSTKMNLELVFANITFGSIIWLLFMILFVVLSKGELHVTFAILALNSYIFMLVCVSLSFLISCLVSNLKNAGDALTGISNVVSLGSSFLCGAFVPQSILSEPILKIASFLPTYWYIKLNDSMAGLQGFTNEVLLKCAQYMGIQLLFASTFLAIALVVMKKRRSVHAIVSTKK